MTDQEKEKTRKDVWKIAYATAFANYIGNASLNSIPQRMELSVAAHEHALNIAQLAVGQIVLYCLNNEFPF